MRKKIITQLRNISLLLVFFTSLSGFLQAQTVKGKVTDSSGEGIPGVNVVIKGPELNGTITNFDGEFTINVSNIHEDVLLFRFIGYEAQEIQIGGQSFVSVVLKETTEMIEDVVVVGFGAQKKESVVGAIVQAKGEDLLKAGSVTSVSESLAGLLPGVSIMQAAGQPGATDANILIRGMSSWNDNAPLYVVDGVERSFNDIDPNEIESISVLKDASATAVFGLKAANGVILVTTKSGKKGKTKVSFSSNWALKVPTVEYNYELDYAKILEHYNIAAKNDYRYDLMKPESEIALWRDPNRDPDFYSYTFWPDYLIDRGISQQYNLNISGGNEKVTYFTSFGYTYDGDIFNLEKTATLDPRTYQKKYNWRSNIDFKITKSTKFSVKLSGDFKDWNGNSVSNKAKTGLGSEQSSGQQFNNLFSGILIGPTPVLSNGHLGIRQGTSADATILGEMQHQSQNMTRSSRIYSDFVLEQNVTKDLKISGKLSLNYSRGYNSSIWVSKNLYYYPNYIDGTLEQKGDQDAVEGLPTYSAEELKDYSKTLYYDFRLSYTKKLGVHDIHLLGLFSRREETSKVSFPKREESWVARATYDFKDKYLFEFNGAYNGNENWAPGLKFGFFPSGAIGWNISEENFMKNNLPFIEYFKIRYSYGLVGSSSGIEKNRFTYLSNYDSGSNVTYGGVGQNTTYGPLYAEGNPANPNNTWETAIKQNLGFEITVLQGRLQTDIDLFDERREDILMRRENTIPAWFGNTSPFANIGKTKNHGIDVSLRWNGRINESLSYWTKANFSMSENRVVLRDDPPGREEYRKQAGKPISINTGRLINGRFESWDDIYIGTEPKNTSAAIRPGDFRFVDYNNDGIIDNEDNVPIGNPSYAASSYAFSLGLDYKNLSIYGMFNGVFNISKKVSDRYVWNDNEILTPEEKDYWTPNNLNAKSPAPTLIPDYNTGRSLYTIRNSSFLRLRTVELKYKLGKTTLQKLRYFSTMEFYVNGHNLITWTKLPKSFDPEARELEAYPITRRYNAGLRFSF